MSSNSVSDIEKSKLKYLLAGAEEAIIQAEICQRTPGRLRDWRNQAGMQGDCKHGWLKVCIAIKYPRRSPLSLEPVNYLSSPWEDWKFTPLEKLNQNDFHFGDLNYSWGQKYHIVKRVLSESLYNTCWVLVLFLY